MLIMFKYWLRLNDEKRKTKYEMAWLQERSQRPDLQELSRAAEDRAVWTSFIHGVSRSQSQLNGM